jgi:hypothetical protein
MHMPLKNTVIFEVDGIKKLIGKANDLIEISAL